MGSTEGAQKAREAQIAKYGGIDGYRAEMRRRRSLHKSPTGFAIMSKEQLLKIQAKSVQARVKNAQNRTQKEDTTQNDDQEAS